MVHTESTSYLAVGGPLAAEEGIQLLCELLGPLPLAPPVGNLPSEKTARSLAATT